MLRNSNIRYGAIARLLHWSIAVIIITGLAGVELHDLFPKGSDLRSAMMSIHFQAGLLVLALIWLRLAVATFNMTPLIRPVPPLWQQMSARLVHICFYVAMIVQPVLGVLMQQAGDRPLTLLGMPLPVFIGVDKDYSKWLRGVHGTIGNIVIALIVFHIAAALWHHFKQHDNTLLRMLPPRD